MEVRLAFEIEFDSPENVPFLVSADGGTHETVDSFPAHNNHEEADTLMVLHAVSAAVNANSGMQVVVYSPDTDVLVIFKCLRTCPFRKNIYLPCSQQICSSTRYSKCHCTQ